MYHRSASDQLADSLFGLIVTILMVLIMLEIFLAIKALNLIVRTFSRYPKNKALWIALVPAVVFTFLALLFQKVLILSTLASISILALLITCKAVEIHYTEVFLQEPSLKAFIHDVKHVNNWWE